LVTTKFKSGELHEKHVVATWNLGNHLSICFWAQGNQEKPVSRWSVTGPSEYYYYYYYKKSACYNFLGSRVHCEAECGEYARTLRQPLLIYR